MLAKKTWSVVISMQRKISTSGVDDENIALRIINSQPNANDDGHSQY
jgi:hypothetical protein